MTNQRPEAACCTTPSAMGYWGGACVANFRHNRTLHCAITGPLFLVAAILALLVDRGDLVIQPPALWGVVLAVTGLAFLLEWRTVGQARSRRHRARDRAPRRRAPGFARPWSSTAGTASRR